MENPDLDTAHHTPPAPQSIAYTPKHFWLLSESYRAVV